MPKTPFAVSIWFGHAPPHSASLDVLCRSTDANEQHHHATAHVSLMDLTAFEDEDSGLTGAQLVAALERMVQRFAGHAQERAKA